MSNITPAMIKELRERTGVGMGECKRALEAAAGNIDQAIDDLRKKGMASAVKKADRSTNEGMIASCEHNDIVAIVEANAETDFVVKNERFRLFLQHICRDAAQGVSSDLEAFMKQRCLHDPQISVDEYRGQLVQVIGENIQVRRMQLFKKQPNRTIGLYSHLDGKIMVVVEIEGSGDEAVLARDIGMHIAAQAPEYINASNVPADVIARESEIGLEQIKNKPGQNDPVKAKSFSPEQLNKILEGKIAAFYDNVCLLRQKFIKDESLTIEALLAKRSKEIGKPLHVVSFTRWSVGA